MNGIHDMGGMECFGPIEQEPDELFHADWERQVLALTLAMGATGTWNIDQSRFARESLPPSTYLSVGYYRIWLYGLESLLLRHGLVSEDELASGTLQQAAKSLTRVLKADEVDAVLKRGGPASREVPSTARFSPGDTVRVLNLHKRGHTRLPAYIRNHTGVVHKVHGAHVFPDSNALGKGEDPQWLYNVRFSAAELWGNPRRQLEYVHVDCWEPYLESAGATDDHS